MGNLNFVFLFTVLSATLWSAIKPSSAQNSEDNNTSVETTTVMVERQRDDVTEINEEKNLTSEIHAVTAQFFRKKDCNTQDLSHYDGLDIPWNTTVENSKSLDVRCRRHYFVSPISDSLICFYGFWYPTSDPCIKGYFEPTFYAELYRGYPWWYVDCHSGSNVNVTRFSRVVNTGWGGNLPIVSRVNISETSAIMDLRGLGWTDKYGAFQCSFAAEEGYVEAVVLIQDALLYFPDPSEVASVGDSVTLRLVSTFPSHRIEWSRDGTRVPSWSGRTEVSIQNVTEEDAGIYSARYEGGDYDYAIARLSVRSCKADVYGEGCDQVCPPCYNGGICHELLGVCVCPEGFVGSNCEEPCPKGFHGADCSTACGDGKCEYRLFCKPDMYGCTCARGFRGVGCDKDCEQGWYGASCKQPCHCAEGPRSCNRITGACSGGCASGWKGLSCQIRDSI